MRRRLVELDGLDRLVRVIPGFDRRVVVAVQPQRGNLLEQRLRPLVSRVAGLDLLGRLLEGIEQLPRLGKFAAVELADDAVVLVDENCFIGDRRRLNGHKRQPNQRRESNLKIPEAHCVPPQAVNWIFMLNPTSPPVQAPQGLIDAESVSAVLKAATFNCCWTSRQFFSKL